MADQGYGTPTKTTLVSITCKESKKRRALAICSFEKPVLKTPDRIQKPVKLVRKLYITLYALMLPSIKFLLHVVLIQVIKHSVPENKVNALLFKQSLPTNTRNIWKTLIPESSKGVASSPRVTA